MATTIMISPRVKPPLAGCSFLHNAIFLLSRREPSNRRLLSLPICVHVLPVAYEVRGAANDHGRGL